MVVLIQVVRSVVQLRKLKSKDIVYTRGEVAKKEDGTVLPLHKSDDATGNGRDLGVAGQVWSHECDTGRVTFQDQEVLYVSDLFVVAHIRPLTGRAHLHTPF